MKERKLGNFLVGSLKMISFRLSRERNRKIGLNIEKTVVNVKSNKHFWKAVRTKATRSKLTRIGRVWLVEEKVSTLDHIYIYIYRVVQSLRNLEIEVVAVSNTRTFLPAKRNLEETCPILSIFRGELWAITTPSSPSLSLSLSHTRFVCNVCLVHEAGNDISSNDRFDPLWRVPRMHDPPRYRSHVRHERYHAALESYATRSSVIWMRAPRRS